MKSLTASDSLGLMRGNKIFSYIKNTPFDLAKLTAALEASSTYVMKGITNWDSLTTIDSSGGIMVGDPIYWNGSAVAVKPGGNGVAIGANGLFGVQGGVTKFSIDTLGNASFSGTITGANVTTGGLSVDGTTDAAINFTSNTAYYTTIKMVNDSLVTWQHPTKDGFVNNTKYSGTDISYMYYGDPGHRIGYQYTLFNVATHWYINLESCSTTQSGTNSYTIDHGATVAIKGGYDNKTSTNIEPEVVITCKDTVGTIATFLFDERGFGSNKPLYASTDMTVPYATQSWVGSQGYISNYQGYIDWTTNSAFYAKTGLIKAVNSVGSTAEYYGVYGNGPTGVIGRCDVAHIARASFGNTGSGTGVYGISTVNYGCGVIGESNGAAGIGGQFLNASANSFGVVGSGTLYDFYANGSGANYGPFTGSHDVLLAKGTVVVPGDIIVDTNVNYKTNVSQVITIGEVSSLKEDKAVVGVYVIGSSFDENTIVAALTTEDKTTLKSSYDLCSMNSVGEGQINVIGEGGDIAIGDLIVSSSTPGKGMRQSDGIIYNYTVAKAREAVTFGTMSEEKQIACIYLCG